MTIPIALLREPLRAVRAAEGLCVVVRADVILHIRHLREHFQANFALTALVLTTGLFVDNHHRAPQFFLANLDRLLASWHSLWCLDVWRERWHFAWPLLGVQKRVDEALEALGRAEQAELTEYHGGGSGHLESTDAFEIHSWRMLQASLARGLRARILLNQWRRRTLLTFQGLLLIWRFCLAVRLEGAELDQRVNCPFLRLGDGKE